MINLWLLVQMLVFVCDGYKFLVYSPAAFYSHMNFMGAIADTLSEAGHDVILLMPVVDNKLENHTGVKFTRKVIKVPQDPRAYEMMEHRDDVMGTMWAPQKSLSLMLDALNNVTKAFTYQCERVFSDEDLMRKLQNEKFDVGIAEANTACGFGLFELAKIPASIAAASTVFMDTACYAIGEPINPSYVPVPYSTTGDQMNFVERAMNFIGGLLMRKIFHNIFESEISGFRKKFGSEFKGYDDLIAKASYLMINSNPYLDFPRPMLYKTVPIGGIAVATDSKANQLSKEWNTILNERNTTVLVSFGSMVKAIYMPAKYKNTFLTLFENMPNTTFIMKYEEEGSGFAEHLLNVHLSPWLPQNALLADPRLTAFITHGGLGSINELAHQGKPAVLVPLCCDQTRNALMLARHGGAIVLTIDDMEIVGKLQESLISVINDDSYARNARRLSEMLSGQPLSPKELVVRHSEFAARFGRLPSLDPYGRQLTFVQYYLLDVIAACACVIIVINYLCFRLLKCCFTSAVKRKRD